MSKKIKKTNKIKEQDISMLLFEDERITGKQIELYNKAKEEFTNVQIENPIYIIENKLQVLNKYNNFIKRTLETPEITPEQIEKCLSNSYTRYMVHMLELE
jgi:hypothetical protein